MGKIGDFQPVYIIYFQRSSEVQIFLRFGEGIDNKRIDLKQIDLFDKLELNISMTQ